MSSTGINDYLSMAKQADRAATEAQSQVAKHCWHAIAEEYRHLAAESLKLGNGANTGTNG